MDGVLGLEQNGQVYYYYAVEGTQLYVADGVSPTPLVFTRSSGSPAGSLPGGQQTGPLQGTTGGVRNTAGHSSTSQFGRRRKARTQVVLRERVQRGGRRRRLEHGVLRTPRRPDLRLRGRRKH